ncbi:MAG: hypothetical protein LBF22_09455 [Deltaproteobacteria bacterium]|jgi:hypothetical protein|nr:hypothetical protein [Deltaproteobacteria bacterium]
MISSILTYANNALLYNGSLLASRSQVTPVVAIAEKKEEKTLIESQNSNETSKGISSNFSLSYSQRLKETGLTTNSSTTLVTVTEAALQIADEINKTKGTEEANRFMAKVLTLASGKDPVGSFQLAVGIFLNEQNQNEVKTKAKQTTTLEVDEEPTPEELARKASDKISKEAETKSQREKTESSSQISGTKDATGSLGDIALSITQIVNETRAQNGGVPDIPPDDLVALINKVSAVLGSTNNSSTIENNPTSAFEGIFDLAYASGINPEISNAIYNASSITVARAHIKLQNYSQPPIKTGSLISVSI